MRTSQIHAAIDAMLSYADAQGVATIVRDTLIGLRTFTTDPRRGCQVGSGVELARTVEKSYSPYEGYNVPHFYVDAARRVMASRKEQA